MYKLGRAGRSSWNLEAVSVRSPRMQPIRSSSVPPLDIQHVYSARCDSASYRSTTAMVCYAIECNKPLPCVVVRIIRVQRERTQQAYSVALLYSYYEQLVGRI